MTVVRCNGTFSRSCRANIGRKVTVKGQCKQSLGLDHGTQVLTRGTKRFKKV